MTTESHSRLCSLLHSVENTVPVVMHVAQKSCPFCLYQCPWFPQVHIHPDTSSQKKKQRTDLWSSSATKKQGDGGVLNWFESFGPVFYSSDCRRLSGVPGHQPPGGVIISPPWGRAVCVKPLSGLSLSCVDVSKISIFKGFGFEEGKQELGRQR